MKPVIKAAIFDMDGLLIDSERIIMQACIQAAQQVGITYTQAQYVALIGRAAPDSTHIMTEQLGDSTRFNQVMEGLDAQMVTINNTFPLKIGAQQLLEHYREKNIICSVASSSSKQHIAHRLSQVGLSGYFQQITSGQEVALGKPKPDIYLLALKKLGLTAEECIAFEDSEMGARSAIAAGLKVVVVPDLQQPSDFVTQHSHRVVGSLTHYLNLLNDGVG